MSDFYKTIDLKQTTERDEMAIIILQSLEVSSTSFLFQIKKANYFLSTIHLR